MLMISARVRATRERRGMDLERATVRAARVRRALPMIHTSKARKDVPEKSCLKAERCWTHTA
jgi:hypothetical protein